jgi:hypothetical protein
MKHESPAKRAGPRCCVFVGSGRPLHR